MGPAKWEQDKGEEKREAGEKEAETREEEPETGEKESQTGEEKSETGEERDTDLRYKTDYTGEKPTAGCFRRFSLIFMCIKGKLSRGVSSSSCSAESR